MGEPQDVIADRLLEMLIPGRNSSSSTITVHHDGRGVWLAVTCCVVMLSVMVVGGLWLSREFNRIDSVFNDLNDKDSVQDAYINKLRAEQKESKT